MRIDALEHIDETEEDDADISFIMNQIYGSDVSRSSENDSRNREDDSWIQLPEHPDESSDRESESEEDFEKRSMLQIHALSLHGVSTNEPIVLGVDSGSAVTIIRSDQAADYPTEKNDRSVSYKSACGSTISDEGSKKVLLKTPAGLRGLRTRVGSVTKPLLAVCDLVDNAHRVIFEKDATGNDISRIENTETKKVTRMVRDRGVYNINAEIVPFAQLPPNYGQAGRL